MRISASDYQCASDLFGAVRDASLEASRCRRAVDRMESGEGVRGGGGFEARSRGSKADPNGMGRTDARIDYEARMERRLDEDFALIDLACALLYGRESGRGGVEKLMGSAVADCLYFRYVAAESWQLVSSRMGTSPSHCRRMCSQGLDGIDYYGLANLAADPDGLAEG